MTATKAVRWHKQRRLVMKSIIDVSELKGPLGELLDQFSGPEGRERLEQFKLWQKGVSPLLQPVATVEVAEVRRFVAREHLVAANIGWTGENFNRQFLDKVEENVPARRIAVHALVKGSLDPEIMVELGRARRVTHLAHFFQLLKKQTKGEVGPLLTNDASNVAYCFGVDGNFWVVRAYWRSLRHCWGVGADSIGNPLEWGGGLRVLSQAA